MRLVAVISLLAAVSLGCASGTKDEATSHAGGDGRGDGDPADADTDTDTDADADADTDTTDPVDSDGDGLSDDDEADRGTDPDDTDSDDDGIGDGEEVDLGSDPTAADTDGDTYLDGWEVTEGHDPTDADDRIYEGYWPYNPDKDAMSDPGWRGTASTGDQLPRFAWVDQYGDTVDIYDFAFKGKPVVVDLSGVWCYYCNEVAAFLDGQASIWDEYREYRSIPGLVNDGDIYWVTVLDSDASAGAISNRDLSDWYDAYPNPNIPVLGDEEYALQGWMDVVGYPSIMLLNEDLIVAVYDPDNYGVVFDALLDL